jgi:hypothetical protein
MLNQGIKLPGRKEINKTLSTRCPGFSKTSLDLISYIVSMCDLPSLFSPVIYPVGLSFGGGTGLPPLGNPVQ